MASEHRASFHGCATDSAVEYPQPRLEPSLSSCTASLGNTSPQLSCGTSWAKSEAFLGWSSEVRAIILGLGQEGPVEGTCQGLGCLAAIMMPVHWGTSSACCSVKSKESPSNGGTGNHGTIFPLSITQVCPGAHQVGFGLVEQNMVRCSWEQVQLPAVRWCWLLQHFSAQPFQHQMWWFKLPVDEVSLTRTKGRRRLVQLAQRCALIKTEAGTLGLWPKPKTQAWLACGYVCANKLGRGRSCTLLCGWVTLSGP